ncbi:MAG: hypothetical protein AB8B85_20465, partial [Paracoccaceae bacterium]
KRQDPFRLPMALCGADPRGIKECSLAHSSRQAEGHRGAMWTPARDDPDLLAVRAFAAIGAGLWIDKSPNGRTFFSNRLKQAILSARIKSRGFDFVAAKVLPWSPKEARELKEFVYRIFHLVD